MAFYFPFINFCLGWPISIEEWPFRGFAASVNRRTSIIGPCASSKVRQNIVINNTSILSTFFQRKLLLRLGMKYIKVQIRGLSRRILFEKLFGLVRWRWFWWLGCWHSLFGLCTASHATNQVSLPNFHVGGSTAWRELIRRYIRHSLRRYTALIPWKVNGQLPKRQGRHQQVGNQQRHPTRKAGTQRRPFTQNETVKQKYHPAWQPPLPQSRMSPQHPFQNHPGQITKSSDTTPSHPLPFQQIQFHGPS